MLQREGGALRQLLGLTAEAGAVVAHDLRNRLSAVMMASSALTDAQPTDVGKQVARIHRAGMSSQAG